MDSLQTEIGIHANLPVELGKIHVGKYVLVYVNVYAYAWEQ